MDMDALEITKTNAIKKYEENIYLLGNIFDLSDNRIIENDEENLLEKNFQNFNKINNTKNNNNNNLSEENEEEDTLNEVIDFFDKNKEDDNEDMDQDEKMDRLLRDIKKKDEKNNGINQKLIEQLNSAYESYKDTKDLLIKKENIEYLKIIKSNINNNYIMLQVKINEKNLNKDIRLLNQVSTYKNFCNFERDDIEVIINNHIVPIKFYDLSREKNKESKGNFLN